MGSILLCGDLLIPEKQHSKGEAKCNDSKFQNHSGLFSLFHWNLEMYDFLFFICKSECSHGHRIKNL